MKAVVALAVLACVAMVSASEYAEEGYGYGYPAYPVYHGYRGPYLRHGYGGIRAPYNNAHRQEALNKVADEEGASSGTAEDDGVPGTGLNFGYRYGYGYPYGYPHGHGAYGYPYGRPYGKPYGEYTAAGKEAAAEE